MRILVLIDLETADLRDPQLTCPRKQATGAVELHVVSALRRLGHEATVLPLEQPMARTIRSLESTKTDLVFNLTEHVGGDRCKDAYIASLLERLDLPYTGTGPAGLVLCRDKARSKILLRRRGFDVPSFEVLPVGEKRLSETLRYPVLVKPLMGDASEEMARDSLAFTEHMALDRAAFLHYRTGQAVICEEFIQGREFKIALLGNNSPVVLPPREVCFGSAERGGPEFITSRVKNDPEYRRKMNISYPKAHLSPDEQRRVARAAIRMYRLLEMRDYGKIDARLTPDGRLFFIEGNPNPDLSPAGFGMMASWAGLRYADLISRIVRLALLRQKQTVSRRRKN